MSLLHVSHSFKNPTLSPVHSCFRVLSLLAVPSKLLESPSILAEEKGHSLHVMALKEHEFMTQVLLFCFFKMGFLCLALAVLELKL